VPSPARRVSLLPLLALLGAMVATLLPVGASAAPLARTPSRAIEGFAPYRAQTICSPSAKSGTIALRSLIMHAYGGTGDYGIIRNCAVGGRSEHKEGRAWDWKVNVASAAQVRQVNDMFRWLFATDSYGNTFAQARRLGVMYVIWNHRIWSASSRRWQPYTGADAHLNHVHFSLSWAGALRRTSYWTGIVSPTLPAPGQPPTPSPAPATPAGPRPLTAAAVLTVSGKVEQATRSTFLVTRGQRYLLTATGVYRYGAGRMLADAACSVHPDDGTWHRSSPREQDGSWTGPSGHLDLQVLGLPTHWETTNPDGCNVATHAYATIFRPSVTGPLTLKVVDDEYGDNAGGLRVTVRPLGL
jgi:hypothetical protein